MDFNQLNKEQIAKAFSGPFDLLNIVLLDYVSSTNDVAKEILKEHPDNLSIVATNKQTAGRGRSGKSFYSELEHGLYFTLAFYPNDHRMESIPLYTILTAAVLVEVLAKYVDEPLSIKWVNDIFYKGKKVGGILSEMVSGANNNEVPGIVVGIGINLAGDFKNTDEGIQAVAGTVFGKKTPDNFNQNIFLSEFLDTFFNYHKHFKDREFMPLYEEHLMGIGKEVYYTISGVKKQGTIRGINAEGHLIVELVDQSIDVLYGQEVHFGSDQFIRGNTSK